MLLNPMNVPQQPPTFGLMAPVKQQVTPLDSYAVMLQNAMKADQIKPRLYGANEAPQSPSVLDQSQTSPEASKLVDYRSVLGGPDLRSKRAQTASPEPTGASVTNAPGGDGANATGGGYGALVDIAKRYFGTPYVWGGTNPKKGLDCSGFTQLVAKQAGLSVPRTAKAQFNWFKKTGKTVSLENARPGDYIYFNSKSSPSGWHTGIYIGNGKMIDAAGRGKPVGVRSIWSRNIIGLGRLG